MKQSLFHPEFIEEFFPYSQEPDTNIPDDLGEFSRHNKYENMFLHISTFPHFLIPVI